MHDLLLNFIGDWAGKFVDFDGAYGAQCVDLINQFAKEVLKVDSPISELPGATAYEIYQNYAGNLFEKIPNTPEGVPSQGDFVFYLPNITGQTGDAGHVDIFVEGDTNEIEGLDQNYPTGSPIMLVKHNYGAVAGWLHFRGTLPNGTYVDKETFDKLVKNSEVSDQVNDYFGLTHDGSYGAIKAKLDQMEIDKESAQNQAHELTSHVLDIQGKLDAVHKITYMVWSIFPGSNYFGNRLHQIKYIFEKT